MNQINKYHFVPEIPATTKNATDIQRLILQDTTIAGFINPTELADPDNPQKIEAQTQKLSKHPDRYCGYQQENGPIVAYMKSAEWLVGDELPFAKNAIRRAVLNFDKYVNNGSLNPKAYGIFGLVADNSLEHHVRNELLSDLLCRAIGKATIHSAGVINIVIHDKDPLLTIAKDLGFQPVGPKGSASGAPGLKQQRYQRSV